MDEANNSREHQTRYLVLESPELMSSHIIAFSSYDLSAIHYFSVLLGVATRGKYWSFSPGTIASGCCLRKRDPIPGRVHAAAKDRRVTPLLFHSEILMGKPVSPTASWPINCRGTLELNSHCLQDSSSPNLARNTSDCGLEKIKCPGIAASDDDILLSIHLPIFTSLPWKYRLLLKM